MAKRKYSDKELYGEPTGINKVAGPDEPYPIVNPINGLTYNIKQDQVQVQVIVNPSRRIPFSIPMPSGGENDIKSKLIAAVVVGLAVIVVPAGMAVYAAFKTGADPVEAAKSAAQENAGEAAKSAAETVTDQSSNGGPSPSTSGTASSGSGGGSSNSSSSSSNGSTGSSGSSGRSGSPSSLGSPTDVAQSNAKASAARSSSASGANDWSKYEEARRQRLLAGTTTLRAAQSAPIGTAQVSSMPTTGPNPPSTPQADAGLSKESLGLGSSFPKVNPAFNMGGTGSPAGQSSGGSPSPFDSQQLQQILTSIRAADSVRNGDPPAASPFSP